MAIGKLKINYKPQTCTWTNPQIKTQRKSYEVRLIRPWTQHKKSRTPVFKIFNTTNTICGENYEISWIQLINKLRNIIVLFRQCYGGQILFPTKIYGKQQDKKI